jgi:hypothetical protein
VAAERSLRDFVEFLTRSLVEDPDQVEVTEHDEDDAVVLEVRVAPEDLGRVIGRGGRLANAIRIITRAAASRSDKRAYVEIVE